MINAMKKKCWEGIQFKREWSGKVSLGNKIKCFTQWLANGKDSQKSYHNSLFYPTFAFLLTSCCNGQPGQNLTVKKGCLLIICPHIYYYGSLNPVKNDSQKNLAPKESNTEVTNPNARQVIQMIKVNYREEKYLCWGAKSLVGIEKIEEYTSCLKGIAAT